MAEVGIWSSMTSNHEHMHSKASLKFRVHMAFEPLFIVHATEWDRCTIHTITFHAVDTQMRSMHKQGVGE